MWRPTITEESSVVDLSILGVSTRTYLERIWIKQPVGTKRKLLFQHVSDKVMIIEYNQDVYVFVRAVDLNAPQNMPIETFIVLQMLGEQQ